MLNKKIICGIALAAMLGMMTISACGADEMKGKAIDPSWWRGVSTEDAAVDTVNNPVSRGETVQTFYDISVYLNLINAVDETADNTLFKDVNSQASYEQALAWAVKEELVKGYGDGNFGGENSMTREQAAVLLDRYIEKYQINLPATMMIPVPYDDQDQISSWAEDSAGKMQNYRFLGAGTDTAFRPQDPLTWGDLSQIAEAIKVAPVSEQEK